MHSHRRLNLGQRIVTVIGLGVGLGILGVWATSQGKAFGWVGYAPLSSSATFRNSLSIAIAGGLHPWVRLVIWLGLTIFWTVVSIVLLRSPSEPLRD
jgi:hypothetical protein